MGDPKEAGNTEPLHSDESSLPIDLLFPSMFGEADSILSE